MTWVIDASALAELLLSTPRGAAVRAAIADRDLLAPNHVTAEVVSVLRGWSLGGHLTDAQGRQALAEYTQLDVLEVPMTHLLPQVWKARHNLSAYDALCVVLAREVGEPLLTLDRRLAAAAPDCAVLPQ